MLRSECCNAKISKMWSKIIPCEKALLTFYRNYKATRSFPILKKKQKLSYSGNVLTKNRQKEEKG